MPGLDHLIPPPIIGLAAGAGIWAFAPRFPAYSLTTLVAHNLPEAAKYLPYVPQVAAGIAAVGVGLSVNAMLSFKEKETTMTPLVPSRASRLVTTGIYAYTRNPMYLGLATALAAWSLYLDAPVVGAAGIAAFVGYISYFQIRPEEDALRKIFPVEFPEYVSRVRRWI
jgi:protein-S-isoprenylcysteine O-methyltransferase Ste14